MTMAGSSCSQIDKFQTFRSSTVFPKQFKDFISAFWNSRTFQGCLEFKAGAGTWMKGNSTNRVFSFTALTSTCAAAVNGFSLPRCGVHVSGRARLALRSNTGRAAPVTTEQCNLLQRVHVTCNQQVAGLNPSRQLSYATLGKLLTHMCLCHQAV